MKEAQIKRKKRKMKAGAKAGIIAGSIVGFILVAVIVVVCVLITYINKTNYVPLKDDYTILAQTETYIDDVTNPDEETSADTAKEDIDKYQSEVDAALEQLDDKDYQPIGDVYNVLLVGSDTRQAGDTGRSDTMILISINKTTGRIVASSFLRDLYVKIPEKGYEKINAAYAYGGIELLLDTLKYNFSITVDRYIAVDFYAFIDVVDILGGLDVDVQKEELYWANQYIHASNLLVGDDEYDGLLEYADGSFQHLNGKQTLGYARFRYVGNGDFTRTERQRKVMNLLFDKLKGIDAATLIKLLDSVLPQVTTNIPTGEFLELIALLPQMSKYDIISWGVPDEDFKYITINGQSSIGIDFNYYIEKLYGLIYTKELYNEEPINQ